MVCAIVPLYSTVPVLGVKLPPVEAYMAPPNLKRPAPENVMSAVAVVLVISPLMVAVPVDIVIICPLLPTPVKAIFPAFKMPAPTASKLSRGFPDLGIVMVPVTSNVIPEFIETVKSLFTQP